MQLLAAFSNFLARGQKGMVQNEADPLNANQKRTFWPAVLVWTGRVMRCRRNAGIVPLL
ncbi:hypothetical protein [Herbaspirillum aquaticum]|uniref:hypothetical protein n=1 Tax=Herbaspirillum aquaticum TaxID=568783 RepID=UPI001303C779|nr:hypothetical protein [Herbaspirillum aquaticum]